MVTFRLRYMHVRPHKYLHIDSYILITCHYFGFCKNSTVFLKQAI